MSDKTMIVARVGDKPVMQAVTHYKKSGKSLSWFVLDTVALALANGYEYAVHPDTEERMQVGATGQQQVMMLLVRPDTVNENGEIIPPKAKPKEARSLTPEEKAAAKAAKKLADKEAKK